eukprot:TRINITY_DN102963_c0_g1_i1.p1 TRINITY_DN102963_c0_g1~~TRINITY_DN102963_c0_g1_i1.p1  ORF type:complete len:124 (+),score=13.78 TRINITY_DN102963_c0_g1_i1:2-373(+)
MDGPSVAMLTANANLCVHMGRGVVTVWGCSSSGEVVVNTCILCLDNSGLLTHINIYPPTPSPTSSSELCFASPSYTAVSTGSSNPERKTNNKQVASTLDNMVHSWSDAVEKEFSALTEFGYAV